MALITDPGPALSVAERTIGARGRGRSASRRHCIGQVHPDDKRGPAAVKIGVAVAVPATSSAQVPEGRRDRSSLRGFLLRYLEARDPEAPSPSP
jgi:hypothetical protein